MKMVFDHMHRSSRLDTCSVHPLHLQFTLWDIYIYIYICTHTYHISCWSWVSRFPVFSPKTAPPTVSFHTQFNDRCHPQFCLLWESSAGRHPLCKRRQAPADAATANFFKLASVGAQTDASRMCTQETQKRSVCETKWSCEPTQRRHILKHRRDGHGVHRRPDTCVDNREPIC